MKGDVLILFHFSFNLSATFVLFEMGYVSGVKSINL